MTTEFDPNYWGTQATAEYVTEMLGAAASETTVYGQMVLGYQGFIKAVELLGDIYEIQNNPAYPQNIKDAVSVVLIGGLFGGLTPAADIPYTFQEAWTLVNGVPDQFGGGTKEEFWQDLNAQWPDEFPLNQAGDELTIPDFISSPASSVPLDPVDQPLPNEQPSQPIPDAAGDFGDATDNQSPLVMDLDGDGIELTDHNGTTTTTFFDIDADGFAEQTAWVGDNDGLLAIDSNENGRIDDASELFGTATVDGFAKLAELDSNGDLIIDANDAAWSDLLIWNDANQDATSQSGELEALSAYNIVSIDLAGVSASTQTISGNPISHTSTFKYANGSTDAIVDAWLVHDNVNSYDIGTYTFDEDTLWLPALRGYGELPALFIAMSRDNDLKTLVEDFATDWTTADFADQAAIDSAIEDILFTWAGVDGVATGSRGPNINARKLEFLEELFGEEWLAFGYLPDPFFGAAQQLDEAWTTVVQAFRSHLVFQSGGYELFAADTAYNPLSGNIEGSKDLVQSAINDLVTPSTEIGVNTEDFWINVAQFLDDVIGLNNLTGTEEGWLDTAIENADNTLSWNSIENAYFDSLVDGDTGQTINGDSGDNTINGTSGDDVLNGLAGADTLNGLDGDDVISGGDGNDTLIAGSGGNFLL